MKKRIISSVFILMLSLAMFAQKQVTKFLGIPVDGFKKEMIRKLQTKGFEYNNAKDCLTGEFNGEEVLIYVQTKNNKVWRLAVVDKLQRDETGIKIRYNNLCYQFLKNKRYLNMADDDQIIPEDENISYELSVNNKQYQALFAQHQYNTNDSTELVGIVQKKTIDILRDEYHINPDSIQVMPEKERNEIFANISQRLMNEMVEDMSMHTVWFTINKNYGSYSLTIYYENGYNDSHGEDL